MATVCEGDKAVMREAWDTPRVVDELNIAMKRLSYPGRTNGVAVAAEVDFIGPGGART